MTDGVHAQLALKPREGCPLGRVVSEYAVRTLVPAGDDTPPQVVVEAADADAVDDPALRPVEETKETVVCRLVGRDGETTADDEWTCAACGERCPAAGFDHLPVRPYDRSVTDDWLRLAFAAVDESELRSCMDRLDELGRRVSLAALRAGDDAEASRTVLVDLGDLTDRQRETAALAVRLGYFESGGASAGELADRLDVSKSTVSEHLRAVRAKVGTQLFPESDAEADGGADDGTG
jgi:predicted DNA binding protein